MTRSRHIRRLVTIIAIVPFITQVEAFDFAAQLFDPPSTLSAYITSLDGETGVVIVSGVDTQQPPIPFTWDWGDGVVTQGWFPEQHTYADTSRNYVLSCTAHYAGGATDAVELPLYFVSPQITPVSLPAEVPVTIPETDVTLGTRLYAPPSLSHFDATHFGVVPRSTIEYVMSAAAAIQNELVNGDVIDADGDFRQVVLRDPAPVGGSLYSLWFTNPVAFAAGDSVMQGSIQWSSFLHEMGHNFSLNTPAAFYYGGKIDGNANAIYSETMAQIMQHATAYELINKAHIYRLADELVADIADSAIYAMQLVRTHYDNYVAGGTEFHSWNDPGTGPDETFGTFMTLAYKFCSEAETQGLGYRLPTRRMLQLLQTFDPAMRASYDQWNDTPAADAFRATLMVAAMSHAFQTDLRSEFVALNFPVDDTIYDDMIARVTDLPGPGAVSEPISLQRVSSTRLRLSWSDADCTGGEDYGIYEGRMGAWSSHKPIDCFDDDGDLEEEIVFAGGNRYYLVVPHHVVSEGSYGTDSELSERSAGSTTCVLDRDLECEP